MSDRTTIKISDRQWVEAGIKKGYLEKGPFGNRLKKEAFAPALPFLIPAAKAFGLGAAIAPATSLLGAGAKKIYNYFTGNRSLGEMMRGFNVTPQQFAASQKDFQQLFRTLDQLEQMSPRVAISVQEARQEISQKINMMARQLGIAGGTLALKGEEYHQKQQAERAKQLGDIQKQIAMHQDLAKGPGGKLPADFDPNVMKQVGGGSAAPAAPGAAPKP